MRNFVLGILLLALIVPATSLDISSSFRGNGYWESGIDSGSAKNSMSGHGDMSLATKASISQDGSTVKQGLEFSGTKGRLVMRNLIGDVNQAVQIRDASEISIRMTLDTKAKEETADSVLGQLLQYGSSVDGVVNGSISEVIARGDHMGRPIELSMIKGTEGVFEINSSIKLNEFNPGYNSQA